MPASSARDGSLPRVGGKSGLLICGRDLGVKALMDPMAVPEEVDAGPATGHRAKLAVTRHRAHDGARSRTSRELAALQHVDRVRGDGDAPVLDRKHRQPSEVGDDEEGKVGRGLCDESLADLATGRKKLSRALHPILSWR